MYNKDRIMRKLLGKPALDASPSPSSSVHDHPAASQTASLSVASSPYPPTSNPFRPSGSQDATLDTGSPIDCIDRSADGRSAIIAGRHILKIVNLHGTSIQAGVDLRAAILAQPIVKNSTVSVGDQLSIKDVKWLKGRGDTNIFTACANGKIFQYDLTRLGGGADGAPMEVIHMREDSRQMNALDINPSSSKMLAGSQDGIVRCFDILNPIRTHTGHLTFRATQSFKCNAGGIQCVQWSPNPNGAWNFACGTDQGVVLKWDIRKPTAPLLRINAHDAPCTSLAWHFDGDHLLSAGWDKKCSVWDVSAKADKRQKAKWTIHTPAPVADLAWRPGTWSATAQGKRAAQFAVTYDDSSRQGLNICHVWDLARPSLPFKKVHNFNSPPSALLWHDQDLLWTVGHDGLFNQFDIAYAPKVVDHIPTSALSFSSHGDVMAFLDERPQSRRPHRSVVPPDMIPQSYSTSPTAPMLSISRSESEEELAGSFLGARRARPKQKQGPNPSRSSQTLSTTPPGGPNGPIMALAQSIKATGIFRSHQAMAVGRVPPANKVPIYEYLSTHYLETLHELLPYQQDGESLKERVISILHHYSKAAESIGMFRLAQVWLLLAHAVELLLARRLQYHLDRRSGELERSDKARRKQKSISAPHSVGTGRPSFAGSGDASRSGLAHSSSLDKTGTLRSLLSEGFESTSNAPTPLARPIDGHHGGYGKKLTPVEEGASFSLPAPLQRPSLRKRLDSEPLSTMSNDSDAYASTEGYDFYDTETISKAIDVPTAPRGHDGTASPASVRRIVPRHDSDESFGHMFSISSGSKPTTQLTASSSSSTWNHNPSSSGPLYSEVVRGPSSVEFGSHSRGSQLPGRNQSSLQTSASAGLSSTDVSLTQSTEEDQYPVTQTTMDSIDTQQGESHPRPDSFPHDASQTASVGASPYTSIEFQYDDPERSQEADYLPWADDPPYPQPIAWENDDDSPFAPSNPVNPSKIVSWALNFETRSSALNASAMVLLLRPLIRDDRVIDPFHAAAIIKQHHARLMSMKLFTQAALLRKLCVRGWPGEPLAEWGDNYPAVFRAAQTNNVAAFICSTCHKPREINRRQNHRDKNGDKTHTPNPIWQCERCAAVMAPCAICRHCDLAEPAATVAEISIDLLLRAAVNGEDVVNGGEGEDEGPLSTWWYCPGCGHGGHASCLQAWHSEVVEGEDGPVSSVDGHGTSLYSDGCCPFDGCGHACLPGKYRVELNVARTEEVSRLVREVNRRAAAHMSGHAGHGHGHTHHNNNHKHDGKVGDHSGGNYSNTIASVGGSATSMATTAAAAAGMMPKSASSSTRLVGEDEFSPVSGTGSGPGPGPAARGMVHRRRGAGAGAGEGGSGSGAAYIPFEGSMSSTGTDTPANTASAPAAVVHDDANDSIPLSRAVESVRESLAAAAAAVTNTTTSGGSSGRESGGREKRSVSRSGSGKTPVLRQVASAIHLGGSTGGGSGSGGSKSVSDNASNTSLGMSAHGAAARSTGSLALSSSPGETEGGGSGAGSGQGIGSGSGSGSGTGTGTGIGGGSGNDRERRKSVKFVSGAGLVD